MVVLGVGIGAALRGAETAGDLLPAFGEQRVDPLLSDAVGSNCVGGEHSFKLADQVGGAHDLLA